MSGGVPPSSRAGKRRRIIASDVDRVADLVERFKGHDAEELGVFDVPDLPSTVAVIGECDGVLYTTVRDGRVEKYIHKFRAKDKPLLCVSPDGSQMLFIGGRYVFTERGIVDLSDTRNLPPALRRRLSR
ncbi:MAG: hypothetical protein E6Q97_24865 [Desulfurellales bacterium]|nr:MAG: hypothetical protein E6Q97_24865 [Desulfurellales bacterium]